MSNQVEVKAVISAEDKASATIGNVGMSFGKLTAGVAAGQLVAQGFTAVLHGLEQGLDSVVGFMQESISSATNLAGETLKLQRQFGLTAEQASGLLAVFKRYGLTVDDVSKSFGIFQKHLLDVNDSESVGIKQISVLGVATKDSSGHLRNMADVLGDVADKFKDGTVPATERAGVAMELFGRSGKDLIPILLKGKDGIAELTDEAKKSGLVLSQEALTNYMAYSKANKDLQEKIEGVKVKIGMALVPEIAKVIDKVNSWIEANGGIEKIMNERVIPALEAGIKKIHDFAFEVDAWVKKHKTDIQSAWEAFITFLNVATFVFDNVIVPVLKFEAFLVAVFGSIINTFQQGANQIVWWGQQVWNAVQSVNNVFGGLPGWIAGALASVYGIIINPFQAAFNWIEDHIGSIRKAISGLADIGGKAGDVLHAARIPGFASGGYTGGGSANEFAGIVHKGEYVVPKNQVDQSTGQPMIGGGSSVSININVGVYAGSQMEKRKLANELFKSLQDVASSQGMTLDQLWQHNGIRSI